MADKQLYLVFQPFKINSGRIKDRQTKRTIGWVSKSGNGWCARDAASSKTPRFTGKTRTAAAEKMYNFWIVKHNVRVATSFTTTETRRDLWL